MSIEVKFRRGTATQHLSFTGANGEITVDTTNKTLRVHDGVTAGGIRLAKFGETSGNTSTYLQVANASALYTTKAYAASNAYVKLVLANTNSYIATRASWSALTSTNTALRTLISDRLQVANARSYMQVSNTKAYLANTNAFIKSQLANTNAYIATKVNTSTFNAALANTNAYIASVSASGSGAVWSAITSTNTALRTLINDRLQVANASATYQTKTIERAALANTNAYIATKLNTTTFNSALANTNSFIKNQLANTNSYINTRATWSALTSTNTAIRSYVDTKVAAVVNSAPGALDTLYELANALNNDASFAVTVTNLIGTKMSVANTKAYLANTNAFIKSQLANTNAYIATKATWTSVTATNTALRTLISDRLQVANAVATYQTKTVERAALANTNAYIATKVNTSTFNAALANTNAYINSVVVSGGATWSSITSTNTALRALIADRLQVANAKSYMQVSNTKAYLANTNSFIKSQLANTNAYIATKVDTSTFNAALANTNNYIATRASWSALTSTNTSVRTLISDRMQVANVKTYLANTNAYIATKVSTTTFNQALANTNAYIASVSASGGGATWAALTSTNTALRTLISDRLQVANAAATYQTKSVERAALANTNAFIKSQLANTNAYIATRASWSAITSTNTALRTLVNDRLQVSNAVATYTTKLNPTTSGLLAHTGRATISTNLTVSGNTAINGLLANNSLGSAGQVLKTNGSTVYWSADVVGGAGGSSSNSFSGILVGSNVVVADSTSDRLTFVAGSGITIAANPSTDTITFSSTGGGGGGGFSNGQSISVTNLVVTGNTTLSALKYVPRVSSTSSISSPLNWNSDSFDQYVATAQATALTINADSGSPNNGQKIIFRFKDNGTARAISWTTGSAKSFRAIGITLPTTTVINKTLYVGCLYNSDDSRWDVIAVAQES